MNQLMEIFEVFWVFFITNILGYGGGPATIPLVQHEVVDVFNWMTDLEFIEMLAAGNALPGPIATKMAGSVGFLVAGWLGVAVGLIATIVPSLFMKIMLMNFLLKHKESPQVKRLALYVKPTISVLLLIITIANFTTGYRYMGPFHLILLIIGSYYFLEKRKTHPSLVILSAVIYGGIMGGLGLF